MSQLLIPGTNKRCPMFGAVWTLETILNKNDDGQWYQIGDKSVTKVSLKRYPISSQELPLVKEALSFVTSGDVKVNYEDEVPAGFSDDTVEEGHQF
jgi:hypothetical protein